MYNIIGVLYKQFFGELTSLCKKQKTSICSICLWVALTLMFSRELMVFWAVSSCLVRSAILCMRNFLSESKLSTFQNKVKKILFKYNTGVGIALLKFQQMWIFIEPSARESSALISSHKTWKEYHHILQMCTLRIRKKQL